MTRAQQLFVASSSIYGAASTIASMLGYDLMWIPLGIAWLFDLKED